MQSKDTNTRTTGAVKHPEAAEWMAFLYEELAPTKRRELSAHLASCPDCAGQVRTWGDSMKELDQWSLPAIRQRSHRWVPVVKWAAAALLLVGFGFGLGHLGSPASAELTSLKTKVAQLEQSARQQGGMDEKAIKALLDDYARAQEELRTDDRKQNALAFRSIDLRLSNLRSELETVALNTESGFEQTHENLTRLVALSAPADRTPQ